MRTPIKIDPTTAKGREKEALRNQLYQETERLVRKLRQRIFDYYDDSEEKGKKATRVLDKAIRRAAHYRPPRQTDAWGATAEDRRTLARQGIAWGD